MMQGVLDYPESNLSLLRKSFLFGCTGLLAISIYGQDLCIGMKYGTLQEMSWMLRRRGRAVMRRAMQENVHI